MPNSWRLMVNSLVNTPYYVQYILFDVMGMNITLLTFIGLFVVLTSIVFLHLAVSSFKGERVRLRYLASFMLFYWYLMFGYNVLFVLKEIRGEGYSW